MPNYMNFIISFLFLLLLSPILLLVSITIIFTSGFPIFFLQERIGYKNKKFNLIKFRTMKQQNVQHKTKNITTVGKFLRKYSLDEIPNLLNVIKGDMNIVGPRPLLVEYIKLYSSEQLKRHEVKPGITGLAQINGRNKIDWNEKFKFDVEYVKKRSLFLDVKIILMTFKVILITKNNDFNEKIISKKFKG